MEDKLWDRWLIDYSHMDHESFISFEDYKKQLISSQKKVEKVDIKKIIEDCERIKAIDQKGGK